MNGSDGSNAVNILMTDSVMSSPAKSNLNNSTIPEEEK